jgi:hypothetical protein
MYSNLYFMRREELLRRVRAFFELSDAFFEGVDFGIDLPGTMGSHPALQRRRPLVELGKEGGFDFLDALVHSFDLFVHIRDYVFEEPLFHFTHMLEKAVLHFARVLQKTLFRVEQILARDSLVAHA